MIYCDCGNNITEVRNVKSSLGCSKDGHRFYCHCCGADVTLKKIEQLVAYINKELGNNNVQ